MFRKLGFFLKFNTGLRFKSSFSLAGVSWANTIQALAKIGFL